MMRNVIGYCICVCMMIGVWRNNPELVSIFISDIGYRNNHFNLLSVSAILAGFMFTALSIWLGMSEEKWVQALAQTSILGRKQNRIMIGIKFDLICILCAAIFVLGVDRYLNENIKYCVFSVEISCFTLGIYYLYYAMKDILLLIDSTRTKNKVPKDLLDEQRRKIKL